MDGYLNPSEKILKHGTKLPHWQQSESMQFVTFRLGDAMPQQKIRKWKDEHAIWLNIHPKPWPADLEIEYHQRFSARLERWLDEGSGSCLMRNPEIRKMIEDTLMRDQGTRVHHHAWVIMPNHLHLLFTGQTNLESLFKTWKGVSSRKIGQGRIWQKGYRDTMIRDGDHFANAVRYIRRNPSKLRPEHFTLWQSDRALTI
jgi:REP element-mobilizing transposase RayT